jgi:tripeptidyl-peptidase-2
MEIPMYRGKIITVLFLFISTFLYAQDSAQTFLDLNPTGVSEFLSLHPDYDGRGTIIFILDTGVDMGIAGLRKTSTGETKVIDVRDFTGEGDVPIYEADEDDDNFVNDDMEYSVKGADKIKSPDGDYYIGVFAEKRLINSESHSADLNGNGNTYDKYYMVTFPDTSGDWVVYFDTNGNGDLSDEKPIKDYDKEQQYFHIKNSKTLTPITFALNVYPDEKKISLFFDDGSHGTHVAGIAAGYMIDGSPVNGVAPGAKIIGLKLGNNLYTGGCTVTESMKKAYLYADKISKEREEPCIVNMSFGIGSEIEGDAEMEAFLNKLMKDNPYLYVCVANGNEGPGISSTGLPSAADYVFSSGAVLTKDVGRDLYGAKLNHDIILFFSSRGGEVNKPDVVSPGAAFSTVPNFAHFDRFWGTSMASPYSTGVMSLLLSAAVKEYPGKKIPSELLYKAVRQSATHLDNYTWLDQGHGYINAARAWELLKKYIDDGEIKNYEHYIITSLAPDMPNHKAPNMYIRDGSFITGKGTFRYLIRRDNFQDEKSFYRGYNIKSDKDWLIPIQKKTYIRNEQPTFIDVNIDKSKLQKPGLYCGRISVTRNDYTKMPEFDMLATIVIPYEFNSSNNYRMEWKNETVDIGMINRYFIDVPAGQTTMHVKLSKVGDEYTGVRYYIADPDGKPIERSSLLYSLNDNESIEKDYYNFQPGVYEVTVGGYFLDDTTSAYNLTIDFNSIKRIDNNELTGTDKTIDVINYFNDHKSYNVSGEIEGYVQNHKFNLNGRGTYKYPFTFKEGERSKNFEIILSKENFNKITDFAYQVLDDSGKAIVKDALSYRTGSISISSGLVPDSSNLTLELAPAFTNASDSMTITVKEETEMAPGQQFAVTGNARGRSSLYPSIEQQLYLNYSKPYYDIPEGAEVYGTIIFVSSSSKETEYELPITINFNKVMSNE